MEVGKTFQGYKVEKQIQNKQLVNVFQVTKDNQSFAVKEYNLKQVKKVQKYHQILMEKAVISLDSPGIPKLFKPSIAYESKDYIQMELIEGHKLSELLEKNGPFAEEVVLFFAAELVCILKYLHQQGLCHREIQANNIIITKEGHLKLLNFRTIKCFSSDLLNPIFKQVVDDSIQQKRNFLEDQSKQKQIFSQITNLIERQEENMNIIIEVKQKPQFSNEEQMNINSRVLTSTQYHPKQNHTLETKRRETIELHLDIDMLGNLIFQMFTNTQLIDQSGQRIKEFDKEFSTKKSKIPKTARNFISTLFNSNFIDSLVNLLPFNHGDFQKAYNSSIINHDYFKTYDISQIYDQEPPQKVFQLLKGENCKNEIVIPFFKEPISIIIDSVSCSMSIDKQTMQSSENSEQDPNKNKYGQYNYSTFNIDPSISETKHVSKTVMIEIPTDWFSKLFFETKISKINWKFFIFKTSKPRKLFLFDLQPIVLVYYMPSLDKKVCNKIFFTDQTTITIDEQHKQKVIIRDKKRKFVFFDKQGLKSIELYNKIKELQRKNRQLK